MESHIEEVFDLYDLADFLIKISNMCVRIANALQFANGWSRELSWSKVIPARNPAHDSQ